MSVPPDGKVTFQAFATLPPIAVLSGDRDQDLSRRELAECWSDGSLGATRVDRAGFERVWKEVQGASLWCVRVAVLRGFHHRGRQGAPPPCSAPNNGNPLVLRPRTALIRC